MGDVGSQNVERIHGPTDFIRAGRAAAPQTAVAIAFELLSGGYLDVSVIECCEQVPTSMDRC